MTSREQFEEWFNNHMFSIDLTDDDTIELYWVTWQASRAALCPKCHGTGMTDSGGTQPWGEPIEIPCDCRYEVTQ